ncbi:TIGR03943 family putative permease subunit [Calothrix sp. UHCC 0171]|uniref:TIGR03943 family putative permease subunit n=1 Tax=Calothrix sp. UHCC 0171 TaxID=3110245 RepID=UPI002B1EF8B2|nr:TIGR03943 family protein [Calothrix sp. UHCC 0171]MEA5570877.1 TIGR03943 family protein [Calothrix sp. UHCC 0171]
MTPTPAKKNYKNPKILHWLDVLAIAAWGILLLKYWATGKLNLLIHPDYFWLVILAGIGLLLVAGFKTKELSKRQRIIEDSPSAQHMTIFPPGWSSSLLIFTALLGFLITPQVFASQSAMNLSVTELLGPTRSQPQSFRASIRPEDRTLVDWVRTINVYPEPDKHAGQKVKVQGFVLYPKEMGEKYFMLSRFVITCCAADAYPIGLPVKLNENRDKYQPDKWFEVEGKMITDTIAGKRHLTIEATSLKEIPQPKNPYSS